MQSPISAGEILGAIVARLHAGGDVPQSGIGGVGQWVLTLASLLAVVAAGGVAARVARRLVSRSVPELLVLLDQSAAFYRRWPEDRLADAPRDDVMVEVARCRRIVELMESSSAAVVVGPALRGSIDGLLTWTIVLAERLADSACKPSGPAYA